MWGARTHAIWLGSSVFDGARVFEGVAPDLDLHCARVNASAKTMYLKPTMAAEEIVGLTRDGMKKFAKDTVLYVRPMYWAERAGPQALPPDPDFDAFRAHALRFADAHAGRLLHHAVAVPPPDLGNRAGRRQGRLPLSRTMRARCSRRKRAASTIASFATSPAMSPSSPTPTSSWARTASCSRRSRMAPFSPASPACA